MPFFNLDRVPDRVQFSAPQFEPWQAGKTGLAGEQAIGELGRVRQHVHFAFQPIINVHTGSCHGYEALLRGNEQAGFASINGLFDWAHRQNLLPELESILEEKVFTDFLKIDRQPSARLFYNLDNRLLRSAHYTPSSTHRMLERAGLPAAALCIEISELHSTEFDEREEKMISEYRQFGYQIAIDDFGTGHSGLKFLNDFKPDIIKIDRYFIDGIAADQSRRLLISSVVSMAHVLGITIVAEGIEQERDYFAAKEIGCDMVQGFLFGQPTHELSRLTPTSSVVAKLNTLDRRRRKGDQSLILGNIDTCPPVMVDTPMSAVFQAFRRARDRNFLPVVDEFMKPKGVIVESNLKEYIYSPYGKELLSNRTYAVKLTELLTHCPICEVGSEVESVIQSYSISGGSVAVIITENQVYKGILSASALVHLMNEKNLMHARDQNPLTRLPGNTIINDWMNMVLSAPDGLSTIIYFDLDHFKVFNDSFGFRQGDRAIQLFADALRESFGSNNEWLLGHIGGDDFVVICPGEQFSALVEQIEGVLCRFKEGAAHFYAPEDREKGFTQGRDRDGRFRKFPLLSCSAAAVQISGSEAHKSIESVSVEIAALKKKAKLSEDKLAFSILY